jgi:hypothetical protein
MHDRRQVPGTRCPEESIHTSAYDRIKALKGNTIESAAVDLVAIETQEAGKIRRTTTPNDLAPILARIGIEGQMWCDLVWNFKKYFGRGSAAGSPESLKKSASQRNRKFVPGQNAAAGCFASA